MSPGSVARLGVLGGTFNPPHHGHLVMAQEALDQLGLDRVALVPAAVPPHKAVPGDPGAEVRARLCDLAVAGDGRFVVDRLELDREGPSWTVDTLRELHARSPEAELTFIAGADAAAGLRTWREPEAVLALARLAVAEREGARRECLAEQLAPLHDGTRITFFDMPRMDISSSALRRRVAEGRPIRFFVPGAVADEVAARGLYASTPDIAAGRPIA